jgi:uncharacterized protein YukE
MTASGGISANYDAVGQIIIDPQMIAATAAAIKTQIEDMANCLKTIDDTLSGLRLSWTGDSASQATAYIDKWQDAINKLFGTGDGSGQGTGNSPGALGTLLGGASSAASNYSLTEDNVWIMFNQFSQGITGSSSSSSSGNLTSAVEDQVTGTFHTTAVDEMPGLF